MSRREWRCRSLSCTVEHGAVLGRLTVDGTSLVLDPAVRRVRVYLDARKVEVACPRCGKVRTFRGTAVFVEPATR